MDDAGKVAWLLSDVVVPDIYSHNITKRFLFKYKIEIGNDLAVMGYF